MIGELANVSVSGMLRLLAIYKQSGCLRVSGDDGEGQVYLDQGVIVGTDSKEKDLSVEILHVLLLQHGYFHFEPMEEIPRRFQQGKIEEVESLILEASRHISAETLQDFLPPVTAVLQMASLSVERTDLHLHLHRDEWNLLCKVNGEDAIYQIMDKSQLPQERALQTVYGLLSAGLVRKIRFRIPQVMEIANQELGNMGEALVRQAFRKLNIDQSRMLMKDLIALLNELERNITLLLGPSRASEIVGQMWEGAKR
jgi:hypothetical protein